MSKENKPKSFLVRASDIVEKNKFLLPLYSAGAKLLSNPEFNSFEENLFHLHATNEYLKNEGSVLIIANHRFPLQHQQVMPKIFEKLNKKEKAAIALTTRFRDDQNMSSVARMVDTTLQSWGIEPVYFWRDGIDSKESKKANITATKKTKEILRNKGGVFGFFPEGETGNELKEAKPGLWYFGKEAGLILVATTYLNSESSTKFKVQIQKPVETQKIIKTLEKSDLKNEIPQIFSDYLMIKLAQTLPENERGFYVEAVKIIENMTELGIRTINIPERWNKIAQVWKKLESIN